MLLLLLKFANAHQKPTVSVIVVEFVNAQETTIVVKFVNAQKTIVVVEFVNAVAAGSDAVDLLRLLFMCRSSACAVDVVAVAADVVVVVVLLLLL